jgi:hypothetical protein
MLQAAQPPDRVKLTSTRSCSILSSAIRAMPSYRIHFHKASMLDLPAVTLYRYKL